MIRSKAAALVAIASFSTSMASAGELDDIVLWHPVRTAFYEHAPKSMANSMRQAAAVLCAEKGTVEGWLCDGRPLVPLRTVYVTGTKSETGFICAGPSSIKFYSVDMVSGDDCVPLCYDADSRQYSIDPADLESEDEDDAPADESK